MVDKLINAMIAAIIGAVAFVAVQAMVGSSIYDGATAGDRNLPYNSANASAGELMIHDILPLAIAILVVAALFLGLTRVRGV